MGTPCLAGEHKRRVAEGQAISDPVACNTDRNLFAPQNRFNPVTAKPWRDSELRSGASFRVIQGGSSLSCSRRVLTTEIGSPTIVILVTKCRLKTFVGYSALRHSLRMWDDGGPVGDG
jgi:hypothetical protein